MNLAVATVHYEHQAADGSYSAQCGEWSSVGFMLAEQRPLSRPPDRRE